MRDQLIATALREARRDPETFSGFYNEHAEGVLRFVTRRVYDVDTAVDLTAEVFARAFLKRRSFRGRSDQEARAWIYSIATREITDYFRRSRVEQRAVRRLGMEVPHPDEEDQSRIIELAGLCELRGAVRLELGRLSAEQQEALRLRIVDELPYEQVADELGISQEAARARVARGLKALAHVLSHYKQPLKEGLI